VKLESTTEVTFPIAEDLDGIRGGFLLVAAGGGRELVNGVMENISRKLRREDEKWTECIWQSEGEMGIEWETYSAFSLS
jgi:hypothetical protein